MVEISGVEFQTHLRYFTVVMEGNGALDHQRKQPYREVDSWGLIVAMHILFATYSWEKG